jgi:hypothetical protein
MYDSFIVDKIFGDKSKYYCNILWKILYETTIFMILLKNN